MLETSRKPPVTVEGKKLITLMCECEQQFGSGNWTHISADNKHYTSGNYRFEDANEKKLKECIHNANMENTLRFSIGEKPEDVGYIIVDMDFHYSAPEDVVSKPKNVRKLKHIYDKNFLEGVAKIYKEKIDLIFDSADIDEEKYGIWFMEKKHPTVYNNIIHDGFHATIEIACSKQTQYYLRKSVLDDIEKLMISSGIRKIVSDPVDKVVDKQIIENAWMMYGCAKTTSIPYLLTAGYRFSDSGITQIKKKEIDHMKEFTNLVSKFSIRGRKKQQLNYRDNGIAADIKKYFDDHIDRTNRVVGAKNNEQKQGGTKMGTVTALVDILSPERADDYEMWLHVGFCLYNLDEGLCYKWDDFSRKSQKYEEGNCDVYWSRMKKSVTGGYNIGSLYYWARKDNPDAFHAIISNSVENILERQMKLGSLENYDVAMILYHYYKDQYVCVDGSKNQWYEFSGHRWKKVPNGYSLHLKIPEKIGEECIRLAKKYNKQYMELASAHGDSRENAVELGKLQHYDGQLKKYIKDLKKSAFQNGVMTQCRLIFYREPKDFLERLDTNPNLICCENGIIDLSEGVETKCFRHGNPDDLCSISTGIDYKPYNPESKNIRRIKTFMSQILPRWKVRHHFMKIVASMLYGKNEEEKFYILTGSGGNGKTKFVELLLSALGDYAKNFKVGLLTQKRSSAAGADPAMHKLMNVRAAIASEPEKTEYFNTALIKEAVGGDKLSTRGMYENEIEWMPMFKIMMLCNDIPSLDGIDGGITRRLEIIEFIAKFVSHPNADNPYEFERDDTLSRRLKKWPEEFLSYLVHYYYEYYLREKMIPPKTIIRITKEYEKANDKVKQFADECIVPSTSKSSITLKDIYSKFRKWFTSELGFGVRVPTKKEIEKFLQERYKRVYNNQKLSKHAFNEEDSDDDEDEEKSGEESDSDEDEESLRRRIYSYDSDPDLGIQEDRESDGEVRFEAKKIKPDFNESDDSDNGTITTYREFINSSRRAVEQRTAAVNNALSAAKRKQASRKRRIQKVKNSVSSDRYDPNERASDSEFDLADEHDMYEYRKHIAKSFAADASDCEAVYIPDEIEISEPSRNNYVNSDSDSDTVYNAIQNINIDKQKKQKERIELEKRKLNEAKKKQSIISYSDNDDDDGRSHMTSKTSLSTKTSQTKTSSGSVKDYKKSKKPHKVRIYDSDAANDSDGSTISKSSKHSKTSKSSKHSKTSKASKASTKKSKSSKVSKSVIYDFSDDSDEYIVSDDEGVMKMFR